MKLWRKNFSRNPRIAEFLKAYNFAKEYGEGVDRMCNELQSVGMRLPEYYSNAFILQTVIRNTKADSQMLKFENSLEKSVFDERKPVFDEKISVFDGQKLAIEKIKSLIDEKRYKEPTKRNIIKIYESIDTNQIFVLGK